MPSIGTNALPVAFGNFQRLYALIEIGRMGVIVNPHTTKSYTSIYFARRIAGAVVDPDAARLIKCVSS